MLKKSVKRLSFAHRIFYIMITDVLLIGLPIFFISTIKIVGDDIEMRINSVRLLVPLAIMTYRFVLLFPRHIYYIYEILIDEDKEIISLSYYKLGSRQQDVYNIKNIDCNLTYGFISWGTTFVLKIKNSESRKTIVKQYTYYSKWRNKDLVKIYNKINKIKDEKFREFKYKETIFDE